jgi:hypothetical protein
MNRLKKISIIWGIVAFLLFAFLTTMGFIYKDKAQKYKKLEKNLVAITKKYTATDFNFPVNGENVIIKYDELNEAGLIDSLEVDNQKCDGYVTVTFKNVTEYKAYIKCANYTTHGFDKKNLE